MFNAFVAPRFKLIVAGLANDFQVLAFKGSESINQPFSIHVQLVSENPSLDLESFLHQPAYLDFGDPGEGLHGQIYAIGRDETGERLTRYHLTLAPRLAYLTHRRDQRIFQQRSVPQIIAAVLEQHGILADAYTFELGPVVYPPRILCVQYGETDLYFIHRLCEEEGIHYHLRHSPDGHMLVFGDDQTVFRRLAAQRYRPRGGLVAEQRVIQRFDVRLSTRSRQVVRRDYDFEHPSLRLQDQAGPLSSEVLEDFYCPAGFTGHQRGAQLARRGLVRHQRDRHRALGKSDQSALRSGHFLQLQDHPQASCNDLWLVTGVRHEGYQPQVLEEATVDTGAFHGYRNRFTATPWRAPLRPPLKHPKPRISGSQTATVTGPAGEDVHCDQHGRVKIRFHWGRAGKDDDKSSCWVRVASGWAGDGFGAVMIPRVGMQVLVTFLEGDPDQPLINGCLPNAWQATPYPLPQHKTRSVLRTRSSPPGGANELHLEDRRGEELVYLRAQRDMEQVIGNDSRLVIDAGAQLSLKAGGEHLLIQAGGIFSSRPITLGGTPDATRSATPLAPGDVAALLTLLQTPQTHWGWLGSLADDDLGAVIRHWRERLLVGPAGSQALYRFHDNRTLARALAHLPTQQWPAFLGPLISVCYWQGEHWCSADNPMPGEYPVPDPALWLNVPNPQAMTILQTNILRYLLAEHSEDLSRLAEHQDPKVWLNNVLEQARAWQWQSPEQLEFLVVQRLAEAVGTAVIRWQSMPGEVAVDHFQRVVEQWRRSQREKCHG